MPVCLSVLIRPVGLSAQPAAVFMPHLAVIRSNLPEGLAMRLPTEIPLSGPSDFEDDKLVVRVFPSEIPQSFTVSIFTCERSLYPCLLGSFSVASKTQASAQRELERHQMMGDRIPLMQNVEGYLIDGPLQNPSYQFSTMMWEQNSMIYTISFPSIERENIVLMAASMVREKPLYREISSTASSS
jgi:hypothetical protein